MQHQRIIAPLLPVAITLIAGIIVGRYLHVEAWITLTTMVFMIVASLFFFRFPKIQSLLICLITAIIGFHLIQHPLPNIPVVQRAGKRMIEYRERLLQQYQQEISPEAYEVVAAMTLGDKSALSQQTKETFNATGASHILAISGLHLGIIYMMVSLLIWGRRWRLVTQVLTLVLLWAFAFLVGLSPSVVRAAIMLTVYGLLSLGYRQKMSINVLAFTAIIMLIVHPHALFEVGFQMSYLAVLSILLFYPLFFHLISDKWLMEHRFVRWVWGMCIVSFTAQLGVAPLIAFYFHRFSTYFLLSNFIVIPCAYLILLGGFLLLLTSWSFVATILSAVVSVMTVSLSFIASLPYATIEGLYPIPLQVVLTYLLIFLSIYLVFRSIYTNFVVKYE